MKQILLLSLRDGATQLAEVPAPSAAAGGVLIHTTTSLVFAGTERMLVECGKAKGLVIRVKALAPANASSPG